MRADVHAELAAIGWPVGTLPGIPIIGDDQIAAMRLRIAMCQLQRFMIWVECEAWAQHWAAEWTPRGALQGAREEQLARAVVNRDLRVEYYGR